MRFRFALAIGVAVCTCFSSCSDESEAPGARDLERALERPAPTQAEVADATYPGIAETPVRLSDGEWSSEPFADDGPIRQRVWLVDGFRRVGDLDRDGAGEAYVLLAENSGGSGSYVYLAAVEASEAGPVTVGTALLGDRVQVRRGAVESGRVTLELVRAGPDDALCCPTEKARVSWSLGPDGLVQREDEGVGRLSLDDLGGVTWVLDAWGIDETGAHGPEITLVYEEGRVSGSAGCNRYFGAIGMRDGPHAIVIDGIGTTRKVCEGAVMAAEAAYLERLRGASQWSFLAGRLAITWRKGETLGTLLFRETDRAPAD